jgi:hypothetical protein
MPRKAKRKKKPEQMHTHLSIRVERYEARVGASVNNDVYAPQYAWGSEEDDPLYKFTAQLTLIGTSAYPKERAGDMYELTIYGDDTPSRRHNAVLRDAQARDERGSLQYRTYRGRQIPVYNPPKGLGLLQKVRGEPRWTGWLFVPTRSVNDMVVLLSHGRDLFVAIHERKDGRSRWVQGMTLQTRDPAEE